MDDSLPRNEQYRILKAEYDARNAATLARFREHGTRPIGCEPSCLCDSCYTHKTPRRERVWDWATNRLVPVDD